MAIADSVEKPPHMPMPTPRLASWRTRLRIHDAWDMYVVSMAKMQHASIFAVKVARWNECRKPLDAGEAGMTRLRP